MKIVSYNLRSGGKTGQDNHWQRLLSDFSPDIVFAQESLDPRKYFSGQVEIADKRCIHELVSHRKWGSAIWSKSMDLETVELPNFKGSVVGAWIVNPIPDSDSRTAMIFSIHAPTSPSYVVEVNKILNEIWKVWKGRSPLILAGDFNVTTARRQSSEDPLKNSRQELDLLNRLQADFGLFNAWQTLNPETPLPQTLRWNSKPSIPYHCDAIFVSHQFVPHLATARIESSGDWSVLSDHNPVIVEMALATPESSS